MNEVKYKKNEYFNPTETKKKHSVEELVALAQMFVNNNTLKPADWLALSKIIKQLNTQKANMSKKVLRALWERFEEIQKQYSK